MMKRVFAFVMFASALAGLLWMPQAEAFQVQKTNPAFGSKSVRWAAQPVVMYLHQDGAPTVSDGSDIRALRSAFQIWEQPSCNNLKFDIKLTTITLFSGDREDPANPASPFKKDGKSVVRFESSKWDYGDGVVAKNATFFKPETGELEETDLLFNAVEFKWSADETPGTLDITTVAMARIGQMIGLWISNNANAVMGSGFDLRSVDRTLRQDDIDGSCYLYNVNGWTGEPPPAPTETPSNPEPPPTNNETPNTGETNQPQPDAGGPPADGGTTPTDQTDGGGCGCQAQHGQAGFAAFFFALLLLLLITRRAPQRQ